MKSKKKCDINRFKPVFFAWFIFRVSCIVDGKRIQFGIGILTKRICYYPLLLVNRYFLTNDYYSPISNRPIYAQWWSHGANSSHFLLNFWKQMKNMAPVYVQRVHTTLMASPKFFTVSDEHRMITHTHTRPSAHLRLCARSEKIYHAQFFSQSNRILKTEPVQNRNRFRRVRYSEMDIPTTSTRSILHMSTEYNL